MPFLREGVDEVVIRYSIIIEIKLKNLIKRK